MTLRRLMLVSAWLVATTADASGQVSGRPPVSVRDTLAFRQIQEVHLSPDASAVAFVTRVADLQRKKNQDTLMVVDAASGDTRTLLTADAISQVTWDRGSRAIHGLRVQNDARSIVRVSVDGAEVDELWETTEAIDQFAVSPDGSRVVVARSVESDPGVAEDRIDNGLVFEYGTHNLYTLTRKQYTDVEWEEFVLIEPARGVSRTIAQLPYEGFRHLGFIRTIAVSPDNRAAAIELVRPGKPTEGGAPFNHDVAILDLETGAYAEPMPGSILTEMRPVWLGDSGRLFFVSDGRGVVFDRATRALDQPEWAKLPPNASWVASAAYHEAEDAVFVLARRSLLRLSLRDRRVDEVATIYQSPSFSADFGSYAFVSETSNERPEVAVYDVRSRQARRLTDLNPYLSQRALGRVEPIEVANASGVKTTGYLVYPVNYEAGTRYPLILASYGFQGRFILTGEWHTTFPAQTLAGEGYAVLLLNTPPLPSAQVTAGDPVKARDNEGWQVLSAFEAAIDLLVDRGIADPDNLGLYGWSHGAFVVEFILAHSPRAFRAASIGEGGDYNPSGYWLFGSRGWPAIFVNTFGGPLTKRTAGAYLEFSPVLNVDKVRTPLLMEFVAENGVLGFEFYVPLREAGVPAELVLYEGEEHNFVKPTVRLASMNRKVDWFNFWMRGTASADKTEQNTRWRALKAVWDASRSGR